MSARHVVSMVIMSITFPILAVTGALWIPALCLPPVVALLSVLHLPLRRTALVLAPWTALPALGLAVLARPDMGTADVQIPWLLLGTRLAVDTTGQIFLFFTALLWTLAGFYARRYLDSDVARPRFTFFFQLAMTGNLGLIVAGDIVSFYTFFALMSFAAYGLVVHRGDVLAYRAGLVYLIMAVLGEGLLLAGLTGVAWLAGSLDLREIPATVAASPAQNIAILLILSGFGVKAGAIPLHVWLPLAHPVAPTPASAVLSGCMIKAGLLGWLRFLPLGETTSPGWGMLCLAVGIVAAFYGVAIGLFQDDPKTILAYSSISQMGFMTMGIGIGLANPEAWSLTLLGLLLYALHHALAKGALFLGVGVAAAHTEQVWQHRLIVAGLAFAALALAGAPLTSGAAAKSVFKVMIGAAPEQWPGLLDVLLPLTAVGTSLLMGRFLFSPALWERRGSEVHRLSAGLWVPWGLLLTASAGSWFLPWFYALDLMDRRLLTPQNLWIGTWPVLAALVLLWSARYVGYRWKGAGAIRGLSVAAGDLLIAVEWTVERFAWFIQNYVATPISRSGGRLVSASSALLRGRGRRDTLVELELRLAHWGITGVLLLALISALLGLLYWTA
jgi:formate hydrogenlyase subunit 3/multisubunit Na+/H+ antiporter MnhD subunit